MGLKETISEYYFHKLEFCWTSPGSKASSQACHLKSIWRSNSGPEKLSARIILIGAAGVWRSTNCKKFWKGRSQPKKYVILIIRNGATRFNRNAKLPKNKFVLIQPNYSFWWRQHSKATHPGHSSLIGLFLITCLSWRRRCGN